MVLINNNRTLVGGFKQPNAAEVVRGCSGRGDGDGGVAVGGDVGVVGLHYLLAKVVPAGTAPGPNNSDHNVNTITNGDGMPRMRTFRETIFPE
ncbi:hypothetical protein Tco_1577945 [Tanacetum coccineum]